VKSERSGVVMAAEWRLLQPASFSTWMVEATSSAVAAGDCGWRRREEIQQQHRTLQFKKKAFKNMFFRLNGSFLVDDV